MKSLRFFIYGIILFIIILAPQKSSSQNYWTPEDFRYFMDRYGATHGRMRDTKDYLPQQRFSYPFEFYQLTQFYANWQLMDEDSADYGGIIEAESGELRNVIQTDNTQEVIWAWCYFSQFTGDSRHDDNIDFAWHYVMNFPAYDEEYSTYSYYYPVWNCGLGLLAEMKFREVFGDSTYFEYADSCAKHIIDNPLSFTPSEPGYRILHPMVTGFLAGALYKYAVNVDNEVFKTAALDEALRVKEWIEDYPALHLDWVAWAMSSGTAMWGVLNSYFMEYPEEAPDWIANYARYLPPMVEPPGEYDPYVWDNSWNIWYANCYRSIAHFVPDTLYYNRFRRIFEYLLAQDTDNDGGIPASYDHPPTEDMTWISAYISLMGLETIIDSLPDYDAGVLSLDVEFESPLTYRDTAGLDFIIANFGINPVEEVHFTLYADLGIPFDTTLDLGLGEIYQPATPVPWVPGVEGTHYVEAHTYYTLDEASWNDTLSMHIEATPMRMLWGYVTNGCGDGIDAKVRCWLYQDESLTLYDSTFTNRLSGMYEIMLPTLAYKLEFIPEFPYFSASEDSITVDPESDTTVFEITLYPADMLLVDDDGGAEYESYYLDALNEIGITHYYWDYETRGIFEAHNIDQLNTPIVIWFTGDCSTSTLTEVDRDSLSYLLDNGAGLLLTGKDIGDDIGTLDFYSEYLKCEFYDNASVSIINNVPGDPITGGLRSVMLGGSGSAGNQDSPDMLTPLSGAIPIFRFPTDSLHAAGIRYTHPSLSKLVYLGFGMEGMANVGAFTSREELLMAILHWFDPVYDIPEENTIVPTQLSMEVYPNPFNGVVNISIIGVNDIKNPKIEIYDIRGKIVYSPGKRGGAPITDYWLPINEINWQPDKSIGSGIYLIKLTLEKEYICKKVIYLK